MKCRAEKEIRDLKWNKEELLTSDRQGYVTALEELGFDQDDIERIKDIQQKSLEVILADIDSDGFLLSHFGPIRNAATVQENSFSARRRFPVKLVVRNSIIGVRKEYQGRKLAFVNEIKALYHLAKAGCHVPSIIDVDFDRLALTISYIQGNLLSLELAKNGAIVLDRDAHRSPDFQNISSRADMIKRAHEGKRVLNFVVDRRFIKSLFEEMRKIHKAGFILNDIKFGNVIVEKQTGKPYLIDFDYTHDYKYLSKSSLLFRLLCERDRKLFMLHFGYYE